jgi:hypothetical protein
MVFRMVPQRCVGYPQVTPHFVLVRYAIANRPESGSIPVGTTTFYLH